MSSFGRVWKAGFLVALGVVAMAGSGAYALATSSSLSTSLTVGPLFSLELGIWKGGTGSDRFDFTPLASSTLDFGTAQSGTTAGPAPSRRVDGLESGLINRVKTNQGNSWFLQVNDDRPMTRSGGSETISNTAFKYFAFFGSTEATGTNLASTSKPITTSPVSFYASSTAERQTSGTQVHMQFTVDVPATTPGTYGNSVVITLTE